MTVRLGLVGCGNIAGVHISRFQECKTNFKLVAAVDTVGDRAKAVATAFPGCRAVTDYKSIIDEVDAVMLSLPHHLHFDIGMDFLNAGKHVLMEKPLANTEAECLELIKTARAKNVTLMVAYCMRFHPMVLKMRELIKNKTYGDTFQVSIWTEQFTKFDDGNWAHTAKTLGGGQFFSHGCHYVDILLDYLGNPVRGTHVGTNFGTPWMEKEGTSNVAIEFEGGPLAYHFGTWGARGTRLGYSFHAHCTDAMLEADINTGRFYVHRNEKAPEVIFEAAPLNKYSYMEFDHFIECIENRCEPLTDGPTSVQGLRVIWQLYKAEANNAMADLRGLGFSNVDRMGYLINRV